MRSRLERHVRERAAGSLTLRRFLEGIRVRNRVVDRDRLRGVRAPAHVGTERGGVDGHLFVERGALVVWERTPVVERALPLGALRRERTPLDVGERGVVGGHHPRARAGFDRHVAHGHPALHRERADRRAAVLDHVADATVGADPIDDPEDHVLGAAAGREVALDRDRHRLRGLLRERLRREHVLDLGGADADRECAERAVRRGVRVAAHDHHPGLRVAHLGADHVDDALAGAAPRIEGDAELRRVVPQRVHLAGAGLVGDGAVGRGHVVVHRGDDEIGTAYRAIVHPQPIERLR